MSETLKKFVEGTTDLPIIEIGEPSKFSTEELPWKMFDQIKEMIKRELIPETVIPKELINKEYYEFDSNDIKIIPDFWEKHGSNIAKGFTYEGANLPKHQTEENDAILLGKCKQIPDEACKNLFINLWKSISKKDLTINGRKNMMEIEKPKYINPNNKEQTKLDQQKNKKIVVVILEGIDDHKKAIALLNGTLPGIFDRIVKDISIYSILELINSEELKIEDLIQILNETDTDSLINHLKKGEDIITVYVSLMASIRSKRTKSLMEMLESGKLYAIMREDREKFIFICNQDDKIFNNFVTLVQESDIDKFILYYRAHDAIKIGGHLEDEISFKNTLRSIDSTLQC